MVNGGGDTGPRPSGVKRSELVGVGGNDGGSDGDGSGGSNDGGFGDRGRFPYRSSAAGGGASASPPPGVVLWPSEAAVVHASSETSSRGGGIGSPASVAGGMRSRNSAVPSPDEATVAAASGGSSVRVNVESLNGEHASDKRHGVVASSSATAAAAAAAPQRQEENSPGSAAAREAGATADVSIVVGDSPGVGNASPHAQCPDVVAPTPAPVVVAAAGSETAAGAEHHPPAPADESGANISNAPIAAAAASGTRSRATDSKQDSSEVVSDDVDPEGRDVDVGQNVAVASISATNPAVASATCNAAAGTEDGSVGQSLGDIAVARRSDDMDITPNGPSSPSEITSTFATTSSIVAATATGSVATTKQSRVALQMGLAVTNSATGAGGAVTGAAFGAQTATVGPVSSSAAHRTRMTRSSTAAARTPPAEVQAVSSGAGGTSVEAAASARVTRSSTAPGRRTGSTASPNTDANKSSSGSGEASKATAASASPRTPSPATGATAGLSDDHAVILAKAKALAKAAFADGGFATALENGENPARASMASVQRYVLLKAASKEKKAHADAAADTSAAAQPTKAAAATTAAEEKEPVAAAEEAVAMADRVDVETLTEIPTAAAAAGGSNDHALQDVRKEGLHVASGVKSRSAAAPTVAAAKYRIPKAPCAREDEGVGVGSQGRKPTSASASAHGTGEADRGKNGRASEAPPVVSNARAGGGMLTWFGYGGRGGGSDRS
ncbi:unnamed protein product [Sphacelaria rigidula]